MEKLYVTLAVRRGRGPLQPALASDDPALIEAFIALIRERFGIDARKQIELVPPPDKRAEG
jgi:hypothetical protein